MKKYKVYYERAYDKEIDDYFTHTQSMEVEAENEKQAFELINENVNKYQVINESVSEWCVDDITEVC